MQAGSVEVSGVTIDLRTGGGGRPLLYLHGGMGPDRDEAFLAALAEKSKEQVAADLASFRGYYFDHNDDPGRLSRLEAYAGK